MTIMESDIAEFQLAFDPLMVGLDLERDIAAPVRAEFSPQARLDRAKKAHRRRRHLIRHIERATVMAKVMEIAA